MERFTETLSSWLSSPAVSRVVTIAVGLAVILLVTFYLKKGLNRTLRSTDNKYKARKAINFFGYLALVLLVLFVYNDKLGNIGVALGVAGAGIAFALQSVIESFAGWLYIMLSGSVSVGQRIKVGGVVGDVIDIGVMSTTVMEVGDWIDGDLYNGRMVSLSNNYVFKEHIHNYSAEYPFLWDEVRVPVRTGSDHHLARKVFTEVLEKICGDYAVASEAQWQKLTNKYRVEEAQVKPMITLKFDENWITFTLRYIVDYQRRRTTKDKIYTALLEELAKYPDRIMIATASMEVTNISGNEEEH